jgi:hypothetical protein
MVSATALTRKDSLPERRSARRPSLCQGSPHRAAAELKVLREPGAEPFPTLASYEQIVGCVMESVRNSKTSIEDFEKAVEAVKLHDSLTRQAATPITEGPPPITPSTCAPLLHSRGRSYSSGQVKVSLTLDDFEEPTRHFQSPSATAASPCIVISPTEIARTPKQSLKMADIALGDVIGRGSMGTVYRGMVRATGTLIAVKMIDNTTDNESASHTMDNEMSILMSLDHPRILKYLGHEKICQHDRLEGQNKLAIFCEYLPGGSIASLVRQFGALEESVLVMYTRQIVEGLAYLHDNRITHRDMKGDNIILDAYGCCKLADFGSSKRLAPQVGSTVLMSTLKGSVPWMAPEVIKGNGYTIRADIWALGCVVVEMATGKQPWGRFDNIMQAMYRIVMCGEVLNVPEKLSNECQDFIALCTSREPTARPTAAELLRHPFLDENSLLRTYSTRSG